MKRRGKPTSTPIGWTRVPMTMLVVLGMSLAGCGGSDGEFQASQVPQLPLDPQLVAAGQQTFRFDTFGDETFWTDTLQMNKVIESAVDPLTAASVGLKIDAAALPAEVVQGVTDGTIALDDPQTTLALLSLNAVVGVKGEVSKGGTAMSGSCRCTVTARSSTSGSSSTASPLSVNHRVGDDLITPILPQLEAYQWSIATPVLATDGTKWGVASDLDTQACSISAKKFPEFRFSASLDVAGSALPPLSTCIPVVTRRKEFT